MNIHDILQKLIKLPNKNKYVNFLDFLYTGFVPWVVKILVIISLLFIFFAIFIYVVSLFYIILGFLYKLFIRIYNKMVCCYTHRTLFYDEASHNEDYYNYSHHVPNNNIYNNYVNYRNLEPFV